MLGDEPAFPLNWQGLLANNNTFELLSLTTTQAGDASFAETAVRLADACLKRESETREK